MSFLGYPLTLVGFVVPALIDLVLTVLLMQPLCSFWVYGWKRKQEEVNNSLTVEAKRTYLEVFWNREFAESERTKEDVNKEFDQQYQRWYGRRRFIAPIVILLIVAVFENFYMAKKLLEVTVDQQIGGAVAAIAGAYTFVTRDFFSRVQQRNLATADILRNALRMAVAVPVGYAFASLIAKDLAPFITFAVGAFPLNTIGTVLRRIANDKLGLGLGVDLAPDQVSTLSGIDRSIADRLADADITTIPQLAWCDPIQLSMRSNLAFDYVVDICSQALAWVYLTDKLPALRAFGLRGAFEMRILLNELASPDGDTKIKAEAVLMVAANAVKIPLEGFKYALRQIAEDPATRFLCEASWGFTPDP